MDIINQCPNCKSKLMHSMIPATGMWLTLWCEDCGSRTSVNTADENIEPVTTVPRYLRKPQLTDNKESNRILNNDQ